MDTETRYERLVDDDRITTFGRLVEAYALLSARLGAEMEAETGVPLLWYGVLLHVARSPNGMRPMHELAAATAFTAGGVTRLVDRMERAGLLMRHPCASDRRVQWIGLTDAGRDALERATRVHLRGIQAHLLDRLEGSEVEELERVLAKLVAEGRNEGGCMEG